MKNGTIEHSNIQTFEQANRGVVSRVVGDFRILVGLGLFFFCLVRPAISAPVPPWEIDALAKKEAPAFSLVDLNGKNMSLRDLRGKVVLLNFWATWCGPCREEMPVFDMVYEKLKAKGLVVLGISIDSSDKLVKSYLAKRPVSFPVAGDPDSTIARSYKVYTYPTTFLIDKQGVIQEFFLGGQDWDDASFKKKLEDLLQ